MSGIDATFKEMLPSRKKDDNGAANVESKKPDGKA